jgi:hypothetical protein
METKMRNLIKLTLAERALLDEAFGGAEVVADIVNGKHTERYTTARSLEAKGILRWSKATGSLTKAGSRVCASYKLTPHGHEIARVVCAS